MAKPLVWCELRCDKNAEGLAGCYEGEDGSWVRGTKDIDAKVARAKRAGWTIKNGQTVCPSCSKQ